MSTSRPIESASFVTISSTLPLDNPGNHDHVTGGAPTVIYEVTAVDTTPVVKVYVKASSNGTWRQWRSWQQAVDSTTRTERTPGTSITLVAGDQIIVPAAGFYAVRLDLQSGTSATTVARTSEEFGIADILQVLTNSASALDTNIVKYNGSEYTINRVRGLAVGAATTTTLVAAHATKYNMILPHGWPYHSKIHVATGGSTATLRITDGTIDLFGGASTTKPLDITGAAGVFGYELPSMVTGAVNRPINAVTTGASALVADFDYIQI